MCVPFSLKTSICISEELGDVAIDVLIRNGLHERFPQQCDTWSKTCQDLTESAEHEIRERHVQLSEQLRSDEEDVKATLDQVIVNRIIDLYPYVAINTKRTPELISSV